MMTDFCKAMQHSKIRVLTVAMLLMLLVTACVGSPDSVVQLSTQRADADLAMQSGVVVPKADNTDPGVEPTIDSAPDSAGASNQQAGLSESIVELTPQAPSNEAPAKALVVEDKPEVEINLAESESVSPNLPVGPQVGYLAPDFSLQTPDGSTIRLSDLRGRPVVISYWTSWCGPCKNEMQILQNAFQKYREQGFTVVAVNAIEQDSFNGVTEMIHQLGVTYPVVLDNGNQFADQYNALFFPTTYFVDPNGVIKDVSLGDSPEEQFNARVINFLASQ